MKLGDAKPGMQVLYKPWPEAPESEYEIGYVTSISKAFIFVKFNQSSTYGIACNPEDLYPCQNNSNGLPIAPPSSSKKV